MPTAASKFGNLAAILSGDVLLAKSMSLLAQDGDLTIIRAVSAMVVEMVEGEAREVEVRCDSQLSLEDHLHILRMKTAAFVECCCFVGATASGSDPATAQTLGKYGHHLGMAFQIIDDLLDLIGDPQTTGKPRGTDFKEGCMTMPLILLHQKPEVWQNWESKFGVTCSEADLELLSNTLIAEGCVAETKAFARAECELAQAALQELPDTSARALLGAVIDFVQQRQS
jgi:geranylgeranyl pyrophosphate synthase